MKRPVLAVGLAVALLFGLLVLTGCTGQLVGGAFLGDQSNEAYDVADIESLMIAVNPYLQVNEDYTLTFDLKTAKAAGLSNEAIHLAEGIAKLDGKTVTPLHAEAFPGYPAYAYISDVTPWRNRNGVSITLTWDGYMLGKYWNGAWALAYFTITSYEKLTGRAWPYAKRSRYSVAREIQIHCVIIYTPWWRRSFPIDIGFSEWWWD